VARESPSAGGRVEVSSPQETHGAGDTTARGARCWRHDVQWTARLELPERRAVLPDSCHHYR
jgi:hypothetical protein